MILSTGILHLEFIPPLLEKNYKKDNVLTL